MVNTWLHDEWAKFNQLTAGGSSNFSRSTRLASGSTLFTCLRMATEALCSAGRRLELHTISSKRSVTAAFSSGSHSKSWGQQDKQVSTRAGNSPQLKSFSYSCTGKLAGTTTPWHVHVARITQLYVSVLRNNIEVKRKKDCSYAWMFSYIYLIA